MNPLNVHFFLFHFPGKRRMKVICTKKDLLLLNQHGQTGAFVNQKENIWTYSTSICICLYSFI